MEYEEENIWRKKYRELKSRYDDALLDKLRAERKAEKWHQKYVTALFEYSNMINKQAELGIELEGKIKELEGKYDNTTKETIPK